MSLADRACLATAWTLALLAAGTAMPQSARAQAAAADPAAVAAEAAAPDLPAEPAPPPQLDDPLGIDPLAPLDQLPGMEVEWPDGGDVPPWPGEFAVEDTLPSETQAADASDSANPDSVATGADDVRDGLVASALPAAEDLADAPGDGADSAADRRAERQAEREQRRAERQALREIDDGDVRYQVVVNFVPSEDLKALDQGAFTSRFRALSTLERLADDDANLAQVNRRARDDRDLLDTMLHVYGFYDADVRNSVARIEGQERVALTFDITAGPLYTLSAIDLAGLDAVGVDVPAMRAAFGMKVGDPANSDTIVAGRLALLTGLLETGFPFAETGEPDLLVDHDQRSGALTLAVKPGGQYRFGGIVTDDDDLFGSRHLQRIARFDRGDIFQASDVDDLRRAILATGLVSTITLTPVAATPPAGTEPGTVDIAVDTVAAPLRTIAGAVGYGTGEGYRAEVSWEHRNFFPPEGLVRARAVGGTQEQLINLVYRRNNFMTRDRVLTAQVLASNINRDAFEARTFLVSASLERQTNLIFQKKWTWSVGGELVLTDERDGRSRIVGGSRRTFFIAALPTSLTYDGSDDLLDPGKGFRLGGRVSPEYSLQSGSQGYVRIQLDGSYYQPVSDRIVMAGRVRLGSTFGADRFDIAPSRRFYAGGGGSVRGFGFQRIGPRDGNDDPIGGNGLAEFSLEARVRFGDFGVVPFFDAGNVYANSVPDFSGLRYGAGIGVRYYSSFGPLRIDVATPLNRQTGDSRIGVYISLGQAF
ncbi:surface antigen variable number repeat family protein [Blastomonas sp. RAC04]|jgi:translocation and assembly module TamA|uniref:autotransporter assembly complex protein TamA n=1 Tax=Blastomonas sp. RAC04 TaxID=1842535 RepID=UPI00083E3FAF|nr:BamA/TamA family outer membrane protein [Blastomonas sp. RAC04]AOG01795.1 surface antigen variable number repeat family protein [Blastomonas sp. RAC04]